MISVDSRRGREKEKGVCYQIFVAFRLLSSPLRFSLSSNFTFVYLTFSPLLHLSSSDCQFHNYQRKKMSQKGEIRSLSAFSLSLSFSSSSHRPFFHAPLPVGIHTLPRSLTQSRRSLKKGHTHALFSGLSVVNRRHPTFRYEQT